MSKELMDAVIGDTPTEFICNLRIERYDRLKLREKEFYEIFKKPLHLYCDRLAGFDPQLFWKDLLPPTPEDVSYHSMTVKLFGARAGSLVHELICCTTGKNL
jgi:hypothetical protein